MLGGLSVLWGGSFFFVEVAVATLPPLFALLVAHVATRDERLTLARLGALVLGCAGVVVLVSADAVVVGEGAHTLAQFAVLSAAVAYACAGVFGRRFAALGVPPLVQRHRLGEPPGGAGRER